MKRCVRSILFLLGLCLLLPLGVSAAETAEETNVPRDPGFCGEDITWSVEEHVLTITGQGEMDDFPQGAPWAEYQEDITKVVFEGMVTYIGAYSFRDYDKLANVDFGEAVYEIGKEAFYSCDALTEIYLPASFKVFGESSFQNCRNLTKIHSEGRFPSFRQNSLWDTCATIYFPAERPWGVEYIRQLEEAFHGRIEFLASDGSDPYVPTEPETEPEATTVPATEPATEPESQPVGTTTAPAVELETTAIPEMEETEETQAPSGTTEPVSTEAEAGKRDTNGGWIALVVVCVVLALTLVVLVALLLRTQGGKYAK